ncbi:hypothetical protein [Streptomyces sp. Ru87]|nr:hypothetical protein [Streptomyces sp. Ru87]PGH48689.1 hypothetical protein CRI70_21775 [Streptomyces sp. Ru87]
MAFSAADRSRFFHLPRRRTGRPARPVTRPDAPADESPAARVFSELAAELPDEDVLEDIDDCIDLYRPGSKPRCEEAEYLRMLLDARDRIARGL